MTLFHENESPYLTMIQQAVEPPTPPAGGQRLFIDDADGHLKRIDDADVVVDIEESSGGAVALLYEAKRSTNLSLTANVTPVQFDTVALNVGSAWASGVFTAPATGLYQIILCLTMTAATAYVARGYVNGTAKTDTYMSPGDQRNQVILMEKLTAGDTWEVRISATLDMDGSDNKHNWIRLARLS